MEKLIAILLIASALTLNAQEENRKNRIKVNISYSSYQSNTSSGTSIDASEIDFDRMGNYQINAIYVFPKSIEFGVYGGYSRNWFNYYMLIFRYYLFFCQNQPKGLRFTQYGKSVNYSMKVILETTMGFGNIPVDLVQAFTLLVKNGLGYLQNILWANTFLKKMII